MRRATILALAVAALAPPAASAQATLYGSIQGGVIALRDAGGNAVTRVAPGTYTFVVTDGDTIHNFHLQMTSVDTPIGETGTFTYTGVVLAEGTYTYVCDAHPDINGTLLVSSAEPPPPPPPPATISSVSVRKVSGVRVVTVTFSVARHANVRAQLRRPGRTWASASRHLMPGTRTLRVRAPARAPRGLYTLKVTLTDAATDAKTVRTRTVRLPRA